MASSRPLWRATSQIAIICAFFVGFALAQTDDKPVLVAEARNGADNASDKAVSTTATSAFTPTTVAGSDTAASRPLTLQNAIEQALEKNNSIEIARKDTQIARSNLRSLFGFYDPVFTISPGYSRTVQPQTTTLGGADTSGTVRNSEFSWNASVAAPIQRTGGSISAFFNNSRTSTSNSFSLLNPTYPTNLGVSFTQPLFRNREIDQTRRQISIQKKRIDQTDLDFSTQAMDTVNRVQNAYWDLVFALRDQQNRVANLNLSKENLRQIEAKITAGTAAPLNRAEVTTELANREAELISATQAVAVAENTLKNLVLQNSTDSVWNESIVPVDKPAFSTDAIDAQSAMNDAISNRPELKRVKLEKEINAIDLTFLKNQTKPQIDLTTSYTTIGLAGTVTNGTAASSVLPQYQGNYFKSISNLFKNETNRFEVGVTISFPFRNTTAKADLAAAQYNSERIDAQIRAQEQSVIVEVRNAVQAVEASRQQVLAARKARENAQIQLDGERKLFEVGRSTSFLLFQRENSLANARNAEIRAETNFNKALAELQRATATTLRANNVQVLIPDVK